MIDGPPAPRAAAEDAVDHALGLLAGRAPEFRAGLSDHGPMVADALARLGYGWEITAWTCRYAERLDEVDEGTRALRAQLSWRIDRSGWAEVVGDVVPLLIPGVIAGAFHAPIRLAHALRMVRARDNGPRRAEVAAALAYWVEARLPLGDLPALDGDRDPRVMLEALPAAPSDAFLIYERARACAAADGFPAAIDGPALPSEPGPALLALAEVGRDLLLQQPHAPIVYTHAVTGPLACATLVPLLDRTAAQELVAATWQALCAVHAAYRRPPADPGDRGVADWPSIARGAVDSGDEHAIKLALACWTRDADDPDPRWRRAASRLLRG